MDGLGEPSPNADMHVVWQEPETVCARLYDAPGLILLRGGGPIAGRYSYLSAFPAFTVLHDDPATGFAALRDQFRPSAARRDDGFSGGYMGLLAYDLGQAFERVPALPSGLTDCPAVAMGWYDAVLVFDHEKRTLSLRGTPHAKAELLEALHADPIQIEAGAGDLTQVWSDATYKRAVETARDYIRAGDVFQVNLSHAFRGQISGRNAPLGVMTRLARSSPAGFSAYYAPVEDRAIVTNSPERFLSVDAAGQVTTRPIKGTAARESDTALDQAARKRLIGSVKDRAENLMIVDLMRNDLSRVCAPGSVKTPDLFALESYANVHHLVSTVTGQLRADQTVFDLLQASFPPGSITGAPKLRAMEIIAELEGESRGPYCGAMGWIDAGGAADFNVMIRTASFMREGEHWQVEARSGGGITIDSHPEAELAETRAKLNALRHAIEGAG